VTLALPVSAVIQNMSVDKCVDLCTEKVSMRAVHDMHLVSLIPQCLCECVK